jgi:hypothetical protein
MTFSLKCVAMENRSLFGCNRDQLVVIWLYSMTSLRNPVPIFYHLVYSLFPYSVMWAGQVMGIHVAQTQTLMATPTNLSPA